MNSPADRPTRTRRMSAPGRKRHSRSRIARLCVDRPTSPSESKMRASARPPPLGPRSVRASMQIHSPRGMRSRLMVRSELTKLRAEVEHRADAVAGIRGDRDPLHRARLLAGDQRMAQAEPDRRRPAEEIALGDPVLDQVVIAGHVGSRRETSPPASASIERGACGSGCPGRSAGMSRLPSRWATAVKRATSLPAAISRAEKCDVAPGERLVALLQDKARCRAPPACAAAGKRAGAHGEKTRSEAARLARKRRQGREISMQRRHSSGSGSRRTPTAA